MTNLKVLAKIMSMYVDSTDPAGSARFVVEYSTSDGQLTSSLEATVTISDSESAITADVKQIVADAVNTALGTAITKLAVRLF